MKISEERLIELGFKKINGSFVKGKLYLMHHKEKEDFGIFIFSGVIEGVADMIRACGVKTEKDLIDLCNLVNAGQEVEETIQMNFGYDIRRD